MVDEELEGDWVAERDFSIEDRVFLYDEQADAPAVPHTYGSPNGDGAAFERFREANVEPQRQEGFSTVQVKVTRGDLTPGAVPRPRGRSCASTAAATPARPCTRTSCCAGCATRRSTTSGSASSALGLGDAGADQINDVVSCPGTDSCKLGITSSMGLNRAVQERIESMDITDPLTRKIHIKMSGCPNGCSQHHIGNIGFYGASIKVGEHTIPAYVAHIGGNYEGGEIVYGTRLKVRLAVQARARGRRALDPLLRGRALRRERGLQRLRRARRDRRPSRTWSATWRCRSSSAWRRWRTSSTGRRTSRSRSIRGEGECAV